MINNFLPLRVYKKIDILTNNRNIKRVNNELSEDEIIKSIYDDQFIIEEYENIDGDSTRTFVIILSVNSKYEKGENASTNLKKLINKVPGYSSNNDINIIIITKNIFDSSRIKALEKMEKENVSIQNVQYYQIFADPLNYSRAVNMKIISHEEKQEVLDWVNSSKDYYPKLSSSDICYIYLNPKPDDMIEIVRNEDCGDNLCYRVIEQ